jgi:hypothetical protein
MASPQDAREATPAAFLLKVLGQRIDRVFADACVKSAFRIDLGLFAACQVYADG